MYGLNFISECAGNNFEIKIKGGMHTLCWQDGEDVRKKGEKKKEKSLSSMRIWKLKAIDLFFLSQFIRPTV